MGSTPPKAALHKPDLAHIGTTDNAALLPALLQTADGMSYGTPFTTEEEKEFKDLEFRRRRADALDFFNRGVPMSARQQEWLEVQRQRAQQPAWAAAEESAQNTSQNSKTYTNGGPPYSYAEPDYQYPGASEGPGPKAAYSESTYSGYGTTYSQLDEQPKDGAPPNVVENAMTKVYDCFAKLPRHCRNAQDLTPELSLVATFATFECTQEGTDGKAWLPHLIRALKRMYVITLKLKQRSCMKDLRSLVVVDL